MGSLETGAQIGHLSMREITGPHFRARKHGPEMRPRGGLMYRPAIVSAFCPGSIYLSRTVGVKAWLWL